MNPDTLAFVMLIIAVFLIIVGCPVAFSLGGMALVFGAIGWGFNLLSAFPDRIYSTMTSYSLMAVPLFVLMGALIQYSGIAVRLYDSLYVLCGSLRGGLAVGTMILSMMFAACTGIAGASVVTVGLLALPSMLDRGYKKELATGVILAGGGLGVVIPPSLLLILYGPIAGISIAQLFSACLIPGVVLGLLYIVYIISTCIIHPGYGPPISAAERTKSGSVSAVVLTSLLSVLPVFILVIAVLGSIFKGIAAPTEAAGIGVLGAVILMFFYRKMTMENLRSAAGMTLKSTTMIMLLVIGAGLFTTVFLGLGGGKAISRFVLGLNMGSNLTLIMLLFITFIMGFFMDWVGILLILVPVYVPIIEAINVNQLWFGVVFCITLQISYMTPPFAYSIFYLKGIAPQTVQLPHLYRGAIPFVMIQIIFVALLVLFTQHWNFLFLG